MFLRELDHPITQLKGIGPKTAAVFGRLGIISVADILCHLPRDYEDRVTITRFIDWHPDIPINTTVKIVRHAYFGSARARTLKVIVTDGTGEGSLLCFGRNFLADHLRVGERFRLYACFERKFGELQASAFDTEAVEIDSDVFGRIVPLYPLTKGLGQKVIRRIMLTAVSSYGQYVENEIPEYIRNSAGIITKSEALKQVHFPDSMEMSQIARRTLSFEELFYLQLIVGRRALRRAANPRPPIKSKGLLAEAIVRNLPFELTGDQIKVLSEIRADTQCSRPMARLLQGDVGAGKTLVAFCAAAYHIEAGRQVALMAPTEILARQHAETASGLLEQAGIRVAFLSGRLTERQRKPLTKALASGEIDLLIGTHALFSGAVEFRNLGLVIIDEQHRFGVMQRLQLIEKGHYPDLLVMTATPIPRTLALTAFGDLEISTIRDKPPGRLPVKTHLTRIGNEIKVYQRVRREIDSGRQAFFVYPIIHDSDSMAVKSAETMFSALGSEIFRNYRLGLIHSSLSEDEIESCMHRFISGSIDILVATSVVEVGVDVPNATCMVIEHAERFGLAALHQLRGRVGRSVHQSYAFLVYDPHLSETAKQRLKALMDTEDGFTIAEMDLSIRGPGEITGFRQSGVPSMIDWGIDGPLLEEARKTATKVLDADPGFILPENEPIRKLLSRCPPFEAGTVGSG